MFSNEFFQILYLVIGFIFGIATSFIKINIEEKKEKLNQLKEWLSDYEEEYRFFVEFHSNFKRAQWLWMNGRDRDLTLGILRKNAKMFGLFRSKAIPKNIQDSIEIVINARGQGQNVLNEINQNFHKDEKINDDQKAKLDFHLSKLTGSIENANRLIAEYESKPIKMFFS